MIRLSRVVARVKRQIVEIKYLFISAFRIILVYVTVRMLKIYFLIIFCRLLSVSWRLWKNVCPN